MGEESDPIGRGSCSARQFARQAGNEALGLVGTLSSAGFIPIRKKGKLPHKRVSIAYSLEYGLSRWRSTKTRS